jgi:hypothetical protein
MACQSQEQETLARGKKMSGPEDNPIDDQPIDRKEWEAAMVEGEAAPAPQAAAPHPYRKAHAHGNDCCDKSFNDPIHNVSQAEAPRPSAPEKVSLSEAIWRTGGGSGEFRHRLGIKLGHIKPDEHKTNEHPYSCTCEQCESENAKRESRPSAPNPDKQIFTMEPHRIGHKNTGRVSCAFGGFEKTLDTEKEALDWIEGLAELGLKQIRDLRAALSDKVAESRPSAEEVEKMAREFAISVRGEYPSILEYYLDYESAINVMTAWWEWMEERITRP